MKSQKRITSPPALPARPESGHKGMFGRVLVVGGSAGMIGAPVLAGTASLRMGAGLVQIAVPWSILHAALVITPELIGIGLDEDDDKDALLDAAEQADAIVVGPGLGTMPLAMSWLKQLVRMNKPMVIDADALNLLAQQASWPKYFKARAILTPHPGEMNRLATRFLEISQLYDHDEARIDLATQLAHKVGQVVLLKGHRTVVCDDMRVYVNTTGDSSLSKAGSGDVLSGIIGCLLGQKMDRFDAACLGAYLHGKAGELAGRRIGMRGVLARDVIDSLPATIADVAHIA